MTGKLLPNFPVGGRCVCGAIRYIVHGAPLGIYACHCKDCQRFSGGPFSIAMTVRLSDFSLDLANLLASPSRPTVAEWLVFASAATAARVCGMSRRIVRISSISRRVRWTIPPGPSPQPMCGHRERSRGSTSQLRATSHANVNLTIVSRYMRPGRRQWLNSTADKNPDLGK